MERMWKEGRGLDRVVERTGDNLVLLFLCKFNEVNRVAGNAHGQLRIGLRMLLGVQSGLAGKYGDI